ncbi:MAG: RNA polymerase sigma factor SigJ [Acidimicrobiales bacterium]
MTATVPSAPTDLFERERPRLVGLAYRMLGTLADAEDVAQDAWLRWRTLEPGQVDRPEAWLTTVTTRIALDHLRAARRRRETYVGPWLPEPLVSMTGTTSSGPAEAAELADSLRLGFLAVLDELTPVERAVFLMADVFAVPYADIAGAVSKSEVACRQIASRARHRVRRRAPGPPRGGRTRTERRVVEELLAAVAAGDIDAVLARLAPDAVCVSDGGASVRAARRPVVGADRVARFLVNLTARTAGRTSARPAWVNGDVGAVVSLDGHIDLVSCFEIEAGRVGVIRLIRNPDKLARIGLPARLV